MSLIARVGRTQMVSILSNEESSLYLMAVDINESKIDIPLSILPVSSTSSSIEESGKEIEMVRTKVV